MTTVDRPTTTAGYFRFERLEVWQLAREFVAKIYKVTRRFPKDEIFGLISQIRRASVSILLNIAEGSDRKSDIEFKRFLRFSKTSLEEVISGLYVSLDQKFISINEFNELYNFAQKLSAKLNALINSLKDGRR